MINIIDLHKKYYEKHILKGINLPIKSGKTTTIIGSSGCGKSTLLRLILGLEKFDSGEIYIDEKPISDLQEEELNEFRLNFGMVFQSGALFDSMTVGENVGIMLKEHYKLPYSNIRKIVKEKLDMVGLADTIDAMPASLSGGMQKRVAFARAIAHNPKFLLYDEPTTGLDPITSTIIEKLINKLAVTLNVTSIVVTHQISTILNTSKKIVMIHDGKILKAKGSKKIMNSKNTIIHNFVNGLVTERNENL